jgi:ubiquinone biosynthesis monooxygenase Coq7
VERTVHGHLDEQIAFLAGRDERLADLIREIQIEEDEHLAFAEARHDPRAFAARLLSAIVAAVTTILIALSTRGDSLRLRRALRRQPA